MSVEGNELPRVILPIPDQSYPGLVTYDAKDPATSFPPFRPMRPPAGAPNVLVVLLDDVGFGASSAFGGPINMPTAERLAAGGLRYTRFHTTSLCAPTRAALLAGRNHHTVGMATITETATAAPGYNGVRPNTCSPLPEILRLNGYSTAHIGKCHEVPPWESSPQGPFDRWPAPGNGFEYFFGFIGGETNQWYPAIYEGTKAVEPWGTPEEGFHFMADMTDKGIAWLQSQKALMPDKPFMMYFAPGATHAPHHVPKEWADKYKGRFDAGWDALREEILASQKAMGLVPADTELTAPNEYLPSWDETDEQLKPVLRRQIENYAGFLEYADHHTGRLIDAIEQLGCLDDTLIYYIIGDNGASGEGTLQGSFNEYFYLNKRADLETAEYLKSKLDEWGSPTSYPHYAVSWAHALCSPFQWWKSVGSHWGGTRNATVVHWPNGIDARGELRTQFSHVIDVAPTVLEAAGLPQPVMVNGVTQRPMEGTSMRYSFDAADAPERHDLQYFEMIGHQAIYHQGWSGLALHRPYALPDLGAAIEPHPFTDDEWNELYDGSADFSQANNLADDNPDKLAELRRLFLIEAARFNVLPLDDRSVERFNAEIAGRPQLITGTTQTLYGGMTRLSENSILNFKNKSYSITAEIDVPDTGANGTIIAQGGLFGGWSLYLNNNVPTFCYNLLGVQRFKVTADQPVPAGAHQVRAEFAYDGGGIGKGGEVTIYLDGQPDGKGRVDATEALTFSLDETTDVGIETGTTVSDDYTAADSAFTGTINWVRLDVGLDNHDHLIDPADLHHIAMTRQ
jgi:arylsulfatase A-like enzyme